jgi:AcrR family transcriptional regulator
MSQRLTRSRSATVVDTTGVDGAGVAVTAGVEASLVAVAREFFAERGYANASLNTIVGAAELTKGAVYYYFPNKRELFRAVYVAEQRRVTRAVVSAFLAESDVWEAFHAGIEAFFRKMLDEPVRRIILVDAPVALGWRDVRDAPSPTSLELIKTGLGRVAEAGMLTGHNVDLLANLVFGAVCEAAHVVGEAERPEEAIGPMLAELRLTLDRLVEPSRVPPSPAPVA